MNDRPASLLVVTGTLDVGGAERHLTEVLPRLNPQRVRAAVFLLRGGGALQPRMEAGGVPVMHVRNPVRGVRGLAHASFELLRTRWRLRPDLVHYFLPEAYLVGAACGLLAPRAVELMSRRSLNTYQSKYPGICAIERLLHARMGAVLGNSQHVTEELRAEGVREARLGVIVNGVDTSRFAALPAREAARAALGVEPDVLLAVCVANLIGYKGHADLLHALARASPGLPGAWQLALVGRDAGIGRALRRLAEEVGIASRVRWVGQSAEVEAWLAAADIGVLASHEEGFSNSVLEMMAAGLPVVVTRVGGNPEAVEDGVSGLLVESRAPDALGEAIARLAADATLRARLGIRARAVVAERYSIGQCARRYEALYEGLCARPGASVAELIAGADRA